MSDLTINDLALDPATLGRLIEQSGITGPYDFTLLARFIDRRNDQRYYAIAMDVDELYGSYVPSFRIDDDEWFRWIPLEDVMWIAEDFTPIRLSELLREHLPENVHDERLEGDT